MKRTLCAKSHSFLTWKCTNLSIQSTFSTRCLIGRISTGLNNYRSNNEAHRSLGGQKARVKSTYAPHRNFSIFNIKKKAVKAEAPTAVDVNGDAGNMPSQPRMTVLFGSQTGTAMTFAHTLRQQAKKNNYACRVVNMRDFVPSDLIDGVCIVLCSNFGAGEPPSNALGFVEWLNNEKRQSEKDFFKDVNYMLFGLGQSVHYPERYQQVGKDLEKRFYALGAISMIARGEGDDALDIEHDFDKWCEQLWEKLNELKTTNFEAFQQLTSARHADLKVASDSMSEGKDTTSRHNVPGNSALPWYMAPIVVKKELHSACSSRSCMHIELDVSGSTDTMEYVAGDYLGVMPVNNAQAVETIAKQLKLDLDATISTEGLDFPLPSLLKNSQHPTVREALTKGFDFQSVPRRGMIRSLAEHANDPEEATHLARWGSNTPLGAMDYNNFVTKPHAGLMDLLDMFRSVSLDADELGDVLPMLTPRYYSICSSPVTHGDRIHLSVSHVHYTSIRGFDMKGVCSDYINRANVGDIVPIFTKHSLFRLPAVDEPQPIIMICAGCGIAPFRGMIAERNATKNSVAEGTVPDQLFFGVNSPELDWLYQDEISAAKNLQVHMAFTLAQEYPVFVQHKLFEEAKLVWNYLNEKEAYVYVCGDAKGMAKGVKVALQMIAMTEGNMDQESAIDWVSDLKKMGRYRSDVF